MKTFCLFLICLFVQYSSFGNISNIKESGLCLTELMPTPFTPNTPVYKPAEDVGIIVGVVTIGVGTVVLITGTIIKVASTTPENKSKASAVQAVGALLITTPFVYALSGRKNNIWSKRNKKPRGFKNRHHYY